MCRCSEWKSILSRCRNGEEEERAKHSLSLVKIIPKVLGLLLGERAGKIAQKLWQRQQNGITIPFIYIISLILSSCFACRHCIAKQLKADPSTFDEYSNAT